MTVAFFPSPVRFVFLPDQSPHSLLPEESILLSANASPKRRAQFSLGRTAARAALEQLGFAEPPPVLRGGHGEPLWPAAVVGSLSHCPSGAAAAVARRGEVPGLGLDIERLDRELAPATAERFCNSDELAWVRQHDAVRRALLVFSAKESIYKALFPRYRQFFGFDAVSLTADEPRTRFIATLRIDIDREFLSGTTFTVGFADIDAAHLLTWTVLERG
ncbi:MAG: 4'-phosphopantetheinyl transferase superfamily protein [Bdellovibrionales bacterium]|nr:4'-phosphopantetheinyl transferase superfamily protein [Bdellovibrionales bacterium]